MKIKDLISPFILIAAGLAFVLIAGLVIITNGKNKKLIAGKIRIGAFLLSFSWFVSGCDIGVVNCYAPVPPENIIELISKNSKVEKYNQFLTGDTVFCYVHQPTFYSYAYELVDSVSNLTKQSGNMTNDSTKFNTKFFHFILGSQLEKGTYTIKYSGIDSLQSIKTPLSWFNRIYIK